MSGEPRKPVTCPRCDAVNPPINAGVTFVCRACGYDASTAKKTKSAASKHSFQPSFSLSHPGPIDRWARSAYNTGQECIRKQDYEGALRSFRRSLENQPDFVDAHLWIARLCDDDEEKRKHLGYVIATVPNHSEAIRELMILNGELTAEEAYNLNDFSHPVARKAESVEASITAATCSQCGGKLTTNAETGAVVCDFCGYVEKMPETRTGPASLTVALLKQRAKAVQWSVGERLIHCENCGAERTLTGSKLSSHCLFCGSTQVVLKDALDSFRQPDGVVRFAIERDAAEALVYKQLASRIERFKGLFANNKIKRSALNGIYLPFWVFDSVVDITRTITGQSDHTYRGAAYRREVITDMYNNLAIPAVTSPPQHLLRRLGDYDLTRAVQYRPNLLARFSAELYTINFDKASLDARSIIGNTMREYHGRLDLSETRTTIYTGIRHMTFQLLLLPVWIANLLEADGDIRMGLVNGQTGKVVLGKARKPET